MVTVEEEEVDTRVEEVEPVCVTLSRRESAQEDQDADSPTITVAVEVRSYFRTPQQIITIVMKGRPKI